MLSDSSIRHRVSIKGRVEEGQEEQLHSLSVFTYGSISGKMEMSEQEDSDSKNILGDVHSVFQVRLDWDKSSCRVQEQGSESRLREQTKTNSNK